MKRYWLFITDEKNWKIIKRKKIYAVKENYLKKFNQVQNDDLAIIYVKAKKIGGIFMIKSKEKSTQILFKDKEYKYKFNLGEKIVGKDSLEMSSMLIQKLSIFKNIKNVNRWGSVLMGRAIIQIKKEDINYIHKLLKLM